LEYNEFRERQQAELLSEFSRFSYFGGKNNGKNGNRCLRADIPGPADRVQKSIQESLSGGFLLRVNALEERRA
jgi:hypothetical protein